MNKLYTSHKVYHSFDLYGNISKELYNQIFNQQNDQDYYLEWCVIDDYNFVNQWLLNFSDIQENEIVIFLYATAG